MHVLAELLRPFVTTDYECPLCDDVGCCDHKPVCDCEGDCPVCVNKARVADATLDIDAQMLALELALRHKGGMTTEVADGYAAMPPPDGEHLSAVLGEPCMLPEGCCPTCGGAIGVPWVFGYLARQCACGEPVCVHVAEATGPGSRSYPYRVRTYCRKAGA
jgi:hypothetical protein